jgi:hypothetical protein
MGGRDQSERLVAINRNRWSQSAGAPSSALIRNRRAIPSGLRYGSLFVYCPNGQRIIPTSTKHRSRWDIRLQSGEMQTLIDADIDCTSAATTC